LSTLAPLLVLLSRLVAASADDHDEDAMFGDASATQAESGARGEAGPDAAPPAPEHDEASMFGEDTSGSAATTTPAGAPAASSSTPAAMATESALSRAENALALGGQLFLRMNGAFREETDVQEGPLSAPSLLDAFADVRPSDRVRGYAQLRFTFDPTVQAGETSPLGFAQSPFNLVLAQAWTKFDIGRIAYLTLGRQRIRWGTGRFWNPTDFINQEIRNSIDFFDQRVGVDLIKLHFPLEQLGWNLYLIGTLNNLNLLGEGGLAARAEFVVGEAELALSSFVKKDAPLRLGADASAGIGLFDVKAEGVLSRGLGRKLFSGTLDFDSFTFPEEVDTSKDWWFEGVVAAEASFNYTDTDTFSIGAEYFYNQAGYSSANLYPWLFLNGGFVPLYTGQHYLAVYAFAAGPLTWDELSVTVSTLANLSDLSALSRLDVQLVVLQHLTVNAFVVGHWGRVGEFKLGLELPPSTAVPGLEDGFTLKNEMVDVGVAARIVF
jgi:hypothetical protein